MNKDGSTVDIIAARLRETEQTFADTGFTAAVMVQLPRADALPAWKKNAILLGATTLGSAIFAWQLPATTIPDLLAAAATNWAMLLGTAIAVTYGTAIAAAWTARKY